MQRIVFVCLWFATAVGVRAQPPPSAAKPTVVLFVGNSFTYGGSTKVHGYNAATVTDEPPGETKIGGIPAIFKKFTDESGMNYEVHVETVGGKNLEFHYQNALPLVSQGKWDVVVLQGYSTEPVPTARDGKPDSFVKHAALLEKAAHDARPSTKLYLYQTWPYLYKTYPDNPANHLEPLATMAEDLRAGYARAFAEDKHFEKVVPVGEAWMRTIRSGTATDNPTEPLKPGQIDLWDNDNKHPSIEGSYLAALVLFNTITGGDVRKLGSGEQAARDLGIPPGVAVKLQAFAAETVSAPAVSNIR